MNRSFLTPCSLLGALCFFILSSVTCAGGLGMPSGAGFQEMTLGGVTPAPAAILANAASDADWPFIGKMAAALIAVAGVIMAWRTINGQHQTTNVKVEEPPAAKPPGNPRWATWEEVETLRRDLENLRDETREQHEQLTEKLDDKFLGLSKDRSVSVGRLHDKIEATAQGLRAEIDTKAQETRAEIHDLPGKLIQLLRDTGAIGGRKS